MKEKRNVSNDLTSEELALCELVHIPHMIAILTSVYSSNSKEKIELRSLMNMASQLTTWLEETVYFCSQMTQERIDRTIPYRPDASKLVYILYL